MIDFETTGLSSDMGDRATEIAAVLIRDGCIVDQYQSLMNAGLRIPSFIEHLTGISNAMLRKAPPTSQVMAEVADFVGDYPLVAHNASFDRKFWDAELARIGRKTPASLRRRRYRTLGDLSGVPRSALWKGMNSAKRAFSSAASAPAWPTSGAPCVVIGAWRTTCIGASMWPCARTTAACARRRPARTSRCCATSPCRG